MIIPSGSAFILRLGDRLQASLQSNMVGVGWANAKDLLAHKDWNAFKDCLRRAYPELYEGNERALGNGAGSAWRFLFEIKTGDTILVPCEEGFYIAIVAGDARFEPDGIGIDYAWRRDVVWKTAKPIPRTHASNELQKRLKVRNTCAHASDLLSDIQQAEEAKKPLTFNDAALAGASAGIVKALQSAINDRGLEQIVCSLACAAGAKARILPKKSSQAGDADVEAIYDLHIGKMAAITRVLYQVKQHQNISDAHGIQQLVDRMEAMTDEVDKGCFVTTASAISSEAQRLADENGILVLKERELVEWILAVGLDNFAEAAC